MRKWSLAIVCISLLVLGNAFAEGIFTCKWDEEHGGCAGLCLNAQEVCGHPAGHSNPQYCACINSWSLALNQICHELSSESKTVPVNVTLVGNSGGSGVFTPGNIVSGTQAAPITVNISHSDAWGAGVQEITIPAGSFSGLLEFTEWDSSIPTRLYFKVTSIAGQLVSFASVALAGGQTGSNTFSLFPNTSYGYIDTATGEILANVYLSLNNDEFCGDPAEIQIAVSATYNPATNMATMMFEEGSVSVVASSPEN